MIRQGRPATNVRSLLVVVLSLCFLGCRTPSWLAEFRRDSKIGVENKPLADSADSSDSRAESRGSDSPSNEDEDFGSIDEPQLELANFQDSPSDSQAEREAEFELFDGTPPSDVQNAPRDRSDETASGQRHSIDLTLNQVVYACLNEHPTIGAALESIEQTRADFLTSSLFPNPQLFADIQLLPLTRPFTAQKQGGPPQQDVILTYPIDWYLFGKRTAAMNTASQRVQVSEAEFRDLVRQRILIASTSFYDALEAVAIYKLATEAVKNLQEVERITKQAVDEGGRPAVDLSRVRLDLLASQQLLRTSRADFIGKECRLRAVVGQLRTGIRIKPIGDLAAEIVRPVPTLDEAIVLADEERPDLAALRWRIAAEGTAIDLQRRIARPQVAPSFGYTRQYQQQAIGFPDADSWSSSLTMSVPIFDKNQGNIAKAASMQRQVQWQLQDARLNVQAEVEQSFAELVAAEQNARSIAEEQLTLATAVRNSIVEAYQLGGRPLLDVLDAQRNFRETNRLFITSRANYWRALYRFYTAMGRQPQSNE